MMKALISPNEIVEGKMRVVQVEEVSFEVASPLFWVDCGVDITSTHAFSDGQFFELILQDSVLTLADFQRAHDKHINAPAVARQYDSFVTFAMRAGYAGPYQAEATTYASWMDTCNQLGYQILAEVQAGTRAMFATTAEYIALLPVCPLG